MPGGITNIRADEFWLKLPDEDFEAEDDEIVAGRNTWRADARAALSAAEGVRKEEDKEFDANVNRLKACEHIADGDEDWEILRNECPSTAAVARLRDAFVSLRALLAEAWEGLGPFARFADSIEQLDRVEVDHMIRRLTPADFLRARALHAKIEKALGGGTRK